MKIIKLNATTSTNDFLKQLAKKTSVEDYTVVWAENQTAGKGQRGASFWSEPFKSLTFSVYVSGFALEVEELFALNFLVSNAVVQALESFNLTNISIKWPNDILSYNKKIAGILIENIIKSDGRIQSVIGIGVNIQPINFFGINNASSIVQQNNITIDRQKLLIKIVDLISQKIASIENSFQDEKTEYHAKLFRRGVDSMFETQTGMRFVAKIVGVNHEGKLILLDAEGDLKYFGLKEVKLLY